MDTRNEQTSPWLFWYAIFTALMTLVLLGIGGLVTSHEAGMAVPDWPTSYGYNMFALPFSHWVGGVFYEHSHRLVASFVGLLTVLLTRWLGGYASRRPLTIIGLLEVGAGLMLPILSPDLRSTGHFLAGIGGVVLLAALIWAKNAPAPRPLPALGWISFFLVQIQGLLGGLRVVLYKDEIGIFHAGLAQIFFLLVCFVALLTSAAWRQGRFRVPAETGLARLTWVATALIFIQLLIGAGMRHEHAGLAIPDFPLAYGKIWPETNPEAIASYNEKRTDAFGVKPIAAAHVYLHMIHRLNAYIILGVIAVAAWKTCRRLGAGSLTGKLMLGWLAIILVQATLGAFTVWSNKAADIATAHLVVGALALLMGSIICTILFRSLACIGNLPKPVEQSHRGSMGGLSMASGTP